MMDETIPKTRLIFTTHTYYPRLNGVAVVNNYLTRGLNEKGYEIVVVTHYEKGLNKMEFYDGIEIHRVYKDGETEEYIDYIRKLVGPDDVLINVCVQTPTTDLLLEKLNSINCKKRILYVHGIYRFAWEKENYNNLHNVFYKCLGNYRWRKFYKLNLRNFRQYDNVIQLHEKDDGYILFSDRLGIKCEVMNNAVDDAFFQSCVGDLSKYGLPSKFLICVSNYLPEKNQEMCIRAYYASKVCFPLVFVGHDGVGYLSHLQNVEGELKKKVDTNSDKQVIYLQDIDRQDVISLVKKAYLFLFGSMGEKFPLAICEAMASGVPYISTDVGVVSYLPGGITVNSAKKMGKAIDYLLDDEERYNDLAQAGKRYANENLRVQDKVNQLEQIILNSNGK